MDHPLIAVEDPPDFPTQDRTYRYTVLDLNRNRIAGLIRGEVLGSVREFWFWAISIPSTIGGHAPAPSGKAVTREMALVEFKAAWAAYPAEPNWPPLQSSAWLGRAPKEGMGPWRYGYEPRGWQAGQRS